MVEYRAWWPIVAFSIVIVSVSTAAGDAGRSTEKADAGALTGVAVGIEIGEPTSMTLRYRAPSLPLSGQAVLGTGTMEGRGLQLRAELAYRALTLREGRTSLTALEVGAGVRNYRHGFDHASVDEIDDAHWGVRASLALVHERQSIGLEPYVEAAIGYEVSRSRSCSFASGVGTSCPHATSSRRFTQLVVGARYYFAN